MASGSHVQNVVQFESDEDDSDCPPAEGEGEEVDDGGAQPPVVNGHVEASEGPHQTPGVSRYCASSDDEGDDDEEEYEETEEVAENWKSEEGANITCECLICDHKTVGFDAPEAMKTHIETDHDLSFSQLKKTLNLDYPGFVQFVRWAREMKREGCVKEEIGKIWTMTPSEVPWIKDKYLLPPEQGEGDDVDYFLTLDYFASEGESSATTESVEELTARILQLTLDKQRMSEVFQRIFSEGSERGGSRMGKRHSKLRISEGFVPSNSSLALHASPALCRDLLARRSRVDENKRLRTLRQDGVSALSFNFERMSDNELYFDSYDSIYIHHEMVFDNSRTEAYRLAIAERTDDIKGNYVMDLGCGTGILSMFCAQHDPKMVYAVDKSNIIYDAMSSGFENNFESKITYLHRDLDKEDVREIPGGKVNVMVSEFMGYFLFYEGMTESFIRARDKYLAPGGVLLPDYCEVRLLPMGPNGVFKERVKCWDNAYGFRMPALQVRVLNETLIDSVSPDEIIGNVAVVKTLDLYTCKVEDVNIDTTFEFLFFKESELCAICGYFLVDFEGVNNKITLSTSPFETSTHWKQVVFFLPKPIPVNEGDKVTGHITSYPHPENPRWLMVRITIGELTQKYEFR